VYPGYSWRLTIKPTETDNFYMVTLQIGFNAKLAKQQIDDPEMELDIEDEGTKIVRTVYRLFPSPADVNLERDFGLTEEQVEEIADEIPIPGFDLNSLDPRMLASLPSELLEELLPMLETFLRGGGSLSELRRLGEELELEELLEKADDSRSSGDADKAGSTVRDDKDRASRDGSASDRR
jgi:hypothetical protein